MHSEITDRYIDNSYITLLRTAIRVAEKYANAETYQENITGKLELTATVASVREYEINNHMVEH
jgi:hypothetical protein